MATSGIYLIRNKVNGKVYVGQSVNIEKRWAEHMKYSPKKSKSSLKMSVIKHGVDAFELVILEQCSHELFDAREVHWMDHFDSIKSGYNMVPGGQRGRIATPEFRKQSGDYSRGKPVSKERCEKIRKANLGKTHTPETKAKLSAINKGKVKSAEAIEKHRESLKNYYKNMTLEQHQQHCARSGCRNWSQEQRDRLSKAQKPFTDEMRLARSIAIKNGLQKKKARIAQIQGAVCSE